MEAEIVRRLLTVANGHTDLANAVDTLNLVLRPTIGVAVGEVVTNDSDVAAALDVDLANPGDDHRVEVWRGDVDQGLAHPPPTLRGTEILVPAVWNRVVLGFFRITVEGPALTDRVLDALATGAGEAFGRAANIEQARRRRSNTAHD